MGGLSFFLFLVLTFTGLLLMFYYRPTPEYAYNDIIYLRADISLGIMRELHRWGGRGAISGLGAISGSRCDKQCPENLRAVGGWVNRYTAS